MIVLDCETRETALASVARIYGLPSIDITEFLCGFDLASHYERYSPQQCGDQELRRVFECRFKVKPSQLDRVYWFHLTRALPRATFSDGILPLDEDRIWETILAAFANTRHYRRLTAMRRHGVQDDMYNLRIGKPIHAGPYAMLVKEVAWRSAEMGNHDYLNIPEIMQDICNGYHARHGENIHDELHRRLRATVIRFWSNAKQGVDCTESALYYLYCIVRGERLSICANTCLDGKNTVVSALQVESVKQYSLRNETVMRKQYRQVTEQRALSPPVHVHFLAEDSAL